MSRRFTSDSSFDLTPVWSPDGSRIAFASNRHGTFDVFMKSTSGAGVETLLEGGDAGPPSDWSPDGRFLLRARQNEPPKREDIWAVSLTPIERPSPSPIRSSTNPTGDFRRTATGSLTSRTRPASSRFLCSPSLDPGKRCRFRWAVVTGSMATGRARAVLPEPRQPDHGHHD